MLQARSRFSTLLLPVFAAIALSACGGGSDNSPDATTASSQEDQGNARAQALAATDAAASTTAAPALTVVSPFKVGGSTYSGVPCAAENGNCTLSAPALVAYGAGGLFNVRQMPAGAFACNNTTFRDPIGGVKKACYTYFAPNVDTTNTFRIGSNIFSKTPCAPETGSCQTTAESYVAYGANGSLVTKLLPAGKVACNNTVFGDPAAGVIKACYPTIGIAVDYTPPAPGMPKPEFHVGVGTHFGLSRTEAGVMAAWSRGSGMRSTRDEMYWKETETVDGTLLMRYGAAQTLSTWNNLVAEASASIQTTPTNMLILGYGNPRYDGGGQPSSDAAINAYGRYAAWATANTAALRPVLEIWNEWNIKAGAMSGVGAQGGARDYVRLAAKAYQQIKAVDATRQVVVGALADDPNWAWTSEAIEAGLLSYADGFSVHLYNHCMNPAKVGADEAIGRLDALRGVLDAAGRTTMPIYVSEVGWPTHTGACAVTEADAAVHSVRFLLEASTRAWVRGVWYYGLQDTGTDQNNWNHHFGLYRLDGSEKASGCALRQVSRAIADRPNSIARKNGASAAIFKGATGNLLAVWSDSVTATASRTVELAFNASAAGAKRLDLCGSSAGAASLTSNGAGASVTVMGLKPGIYQIPTTVTNVSMR